MTEALVVRNQAPGLLRSLLGDFARSQLGAAEPQELEQRTAPASDPFGSNGGWSIVTGQSPTTYERVGRNVRLLGFERNAVVSACIRAVVDLVGPVRIELYTGEDGDEKPVDGAFPGQALLDAPRVGWSAARLRKLTAAHFVGYGNAVWILERGGKVGGKGLPSGIRLIHPERLLYVYLDRDTLEPVQYDWTDRVGVRHQSPWQDVIHFRDLTLDPEMIFGFPRAASALLDMVTDGEASEYVRQIMQNSGAPGLLLGVKGVKTEGQARTADERWDERMIKRGRRGSTAFMPDVEQVHEIGFNLRELEFPDLRGIAREDICAAFGVDPRMVGVASAKGAEAGLSGVQYSEARRRLYLQTGGPLMTDLESELDLNYCPEFGVVRSRFAPDELAEITEDEEETSKRVDREWSSGLISREEARKTIKRPEALGPQEHITLPKGTSVFSVADADRAAAAEAERTVNPPAPPPAAAATAPGATPAAAPPAAGVEPAQKARVPHPRVVLRAAGQRSVLLSEAQRRAIWQDFERRAVAEEGQFKRTAAALFSLERDQVAALMTRAARNRRDGEEEPPITEEQRAALERAIHQMFGERSTAYETWVTRYLQLVRSTMIGAAADIHAAAGTPHEENPRIHQASHARATRLANNVTATTADQILSAIDAGHRAGLGIGKIADLVDSTVFEGQAPARSATIARTESAGALNEGEFLAAQATGVLATHAWLSQRDGDVRESHVECDAEGFIAMSQPFSNGLMFPGDPDGDAEDVINCRCAQLFSDEAPT